MIELLLKNEYIHKENILRKDEMLLSQFEDVYFDKQQREMYIICEKQKFDFTEESLTNYIDQMETIISGFISIYADNVLSYNVNLVLLLPIGLYEEKPEYLEYRVTLISNYERDKYSCRKIFIDSTAKSEEEIERELNMLPFLRINSKQDSEPDNVEQKIKEILFNNEEFYNEMIKEDMIDFDKIDKIILSKLDLGEESNE